MGKVTFAGDKVLHAVAIHVHEVDGVQLTELDPVELLLGILTEDLVFLEGDFIALLDVLEPGETVAVGLDRSEDVIVAVVVKIVGIHLGTARS